jgi:ABA4-like protein
VARQLFTVCNDLALVGWALPVFAPGWRWTERLVLSGAWSLLLSLVYLALVVIFFPSAQGGFGSLEAVARLFDNEWLLLAGWVHYLAFDLLVGAVEVRQSRAAGIPHLVLVPCLILTLLFGPIGLLVFFVVKSVRQRRAAEVAG